MVFFNRSKNQKKKKGQRGAALVELATATPMLFMVVSGVISTGDMLAQQPWAAQTAYQLVDVLASNPIESAESMMNQRIQQLQSERSTRFGRLELTLEQPEFLNNGVFNGTSYYGHINNSDVVGLRFHATFKTAWNTSIPTPVTIDVIAPRLARPIGISNLQTFSDPSAVNLPQYDCCGVRCDAQGNQCGNANACFSGNSMSACAAGSFA